MPGLVGMISQKTREDCQCAVKAMVAVMQHESFYSSGTCFVPEMGVYAGWAAHGNSFAVNGPSWNEQRDIALILSGECVLDPEAGTGLRQRGHSIGTDKSAWLVHLYEEQGEQFFANLNGLFSGLLIDKRKEKCFLFNDRYGVERIYLHESPGAFYFASEAKALLRVLEQLRSFDDEGVAQYLALGCTLGSRTLFHGIENMPGASVWAFENGIGHKRKYFSLESWEKQPALSADDFQTQFQETFRRVLPRYFESDCPLGISLTAGLDTRMIMACRPQLKERPVCFTYSGERLDTLDARIAGQIAVKCGLEHHSLHIGAEFFGDFATFADRTVYLTDGCFGVLGAHEIYMSRVARKLSPVRLTGNYGGEVLRGVSTFKPLPLADGLVDARLFPAMQSSIDQVIEWKDHQITFAAFCEVPWNLCGNLQAGKSQIGFRTPYMDNEIVSLAYRAPESLRRSRTTALRLIMESDPSLAAIPTDRAHLGQAHGMGAFLRRCHAEITFKLDYYNSEGLPTGLSPLDSLFNRVASAVGLVGLHKHLHYRRWLRNRLANYLTGALDEACRLGSQFWNAPFVKQMAVEHVRGRRNYLVEINAVLTIEAIERQLFRGLPRKVEPLANR
jgi:asparagine synthase (glutamine-hydrolysing)